LADINKPSIGDSKPIVLPGSASAATNGPAPPGRVATSPSSSVTGPSSSPKKSTTDATIPPNKVPLVPPPPPASNAQAVPPTSTGTGSTAHRASTAAATPPPLPSSQPPAKKPRRFFRRLFVTLLFLSLTGFGGGVYYSRVNDNFHDFFTEYVPFGEEAVLYFEERDFRKRFPAIANRHQKPRDTGGQVTIPSQSGVSWKVSDTEKTSEGKHSNALQQNENKPGEAIHSPVNTKPSEQVKSVENAKKDAGTTKPSPPAETKPEPPKESSKESLKESKPVVETVKETIKNDVSPSKETAPTPAPKEAFKFPEVDEPSRFPAEITPIDPIGIKDAEEPVVQDIVKILNDIILVVNADNANSRFSSTIGKAKSELSRVSSKIKELKSAAAKEADEKVKSSHEDFDRAAKELVRRIESEMHEQEARWKDEYEQERQKLHQSYEQKLKAEVDQANQVNEQRLHNELLEQAVEMKRKFIAEVKDRVEEERNGRLGKLSDLAGTVDELEKLTTDWNSVIDTNLKTQHLHVAVEAVRANLEKALTPRPFIRELAALKEIAADDPVVNAAIASINPMAYQQGIPSSAQLIDRFRRVAGEVRKASLLPEEAGVASHASSYLLSKLLFKKKGLATGDDVESILTRTETFLEEGNLDEAAREMNGLSGWAKTLSKDWVAEVRKVLEVQQALDVSHFIHLQTRLTNR
jgi:MICOS complex subunit MIC60